MVSIFQSFNFGVIQKQLQDELSRIEENISNLQLSYIPSKYNIADKATRWSKTPIIDNDDEWFIGPKVLYENSEDWPEDISSLKPPEDEMRSSQV